MRQIKRKKNRESIYTYQLIVWNAGKIRNNIKRKHKNKQASNGRMHRKKILIIMCTIEFSFHNAPPRSNIIIINYMKKLKKEVPTITQTNTHVSNRHTETHLDEEKKQSN